MNLTELLQKIKEAALYINGVDLETIVDGENAEIGVLITRAMASALDTVNPTIEQYPSTPPKL